MGKEISSKEKDLLICSCHSTDHQMVVLYGEDDINGIIYPTVYIHTHLSKRPLWERVKYGIKYIFGYQSRYGAFDEFIFNSEDSEKLQDIANYLKKL